MSVTQPTGVRPRLLARVAGVFYLLTTLGAVFADAVVRGGVVVSNDPSKTAQNILVSEPLYRYGFGADLAADIAYVIVTVLLFDLLRPVNRTLNLVAAFLSLAGCSVGAVSAIFHLAPLLILKGTYLTAFTPPQLQALALLSLKLHSQAYNVSLVFFGCYCLVVGFLIFRSTFWPKAIGALIAVAGVSLLVDSATSFLAPELYAALPNAIGYVDLAGEAALMLWLLVVGVDELKWQAKVASPG